MILKGGVSPAPVSLPPPRLSLRQRLGVSQPRPDEAAEQAARRRVHQITGASQHRQPPGVGQKRRHGAQPHRPRANPHRARRGVPALLHGLFQPLFELLPPLRVRHRGAGEAQPTPLIRTTPSCASPPPSNTSESRSTRRACSLVRPTPFQNHSWIRKGQSESAL